MESLVVRDSAKSGKACRTVFTKSQTALKVCLSFTRPFRRIHCRALTNTAWQESGRSELTFSQILCKWRHSKCHLVTRLWKWGALKPDLYGPAWILELSATNLSLSKENRHRNETTRSSFAPFNDCAQQVVHGKWQNKGQWMERWKDLHPELY